MSMSVPAQSVVLAQSAVAVSHTGDTTEFTFATITIPGGSIGLNGSVEILAQWTLTNSANNKTFRANLASTNLQVVIITTQNVYRCVGGFANRNSVSSQISLYSSGSSDSNGGLGIRGGSESYRTAAVDTSADQTLTLTGQLASSGETITLERYVVKVNRS